MERDTLHSQRSCDARGASQGKRFHLLRQRFVGAFAAAGQESAGAWVGWIWASARLRGGRIGAGGYGADAPSPHALARYGGGRRPGLARGGDRNPRLRSQRRLGRRGDGGGWSWVDRGARELERLGPNLLPSLGEGASAVGVSAYLPGRDSNWQRLFWGGSRMGWYACRFGFGRLGASPR